MKKSVQYIILAVVLVIVAILWAIYPQTFAPNEVFEEFTEDANSSTIVLSYPYDNTIFPPEIIAPTFSWNDKNTNSDNWLISFSFSDTPKVINFLSDKKEWTPTHLDWETIKRNSIEKKSKAIIYGFDSKGDDKFISKAEISFSTSADSVGAPIFYREVNLPFKDAVKDPSKIRWRFGEISSYEQPPIVLDNLPVCGNCHSFSADGSLMGMDVDYANDKGSYSIIKTEEEMTLQKSNIITWSDYKREDGELTFGLLSQVSPDGKYAVSTVKDRSVFVPVDNLAFSQLFFPVKGILAVYNRETEAIKELPGADNKKYVQSNPSWSPDGKEIIFARSKAIELESIKEKGGVLLTAAECMDFITRDSLFKFDLYRIPFNGGKGGKAEPIEGASNNGMSNYFAKYSPDGKWIVFCKAESFMLLQEDSELYIMPAEGGEIRRLACNTSRMNSWHSWSPNSRWLVFSSKVNSPYTQLFIAHIDENGNSGAPVLLSQFTASDRAANIPEFVNTSPNTIKRIKERFIDDNSFLRAAQEFMKNNEFNEAEGALGKALEINPNNVDVLLEMAIIRENQNRMNEAAQYCNKAVESNPKNGRAHSMLGIILWKMNKKNDGLQHLKEGVKLAPKDANTLVRYSQALLDQDKIDEARKYLNKAISLKSDYRTHRQMADLMLQKGDIKFAVKHYTKSIELEPKDFISLNNLGNILIQQGKNKQAADYYKRALEVNPNTVQSLIGLARILISDDKEVRDVSLGIHYAERACELTKNQEMQALLLLISAYAQDGNYLEAINIANIAVKLANTSGDNNMAQIIQRNIDYYKMMDSTQK